MALVNHPRTLLDVEDRKTGVRLPSPTAFARLTPEPRLARQPERTRSEAYSVVAFKNMALQNARPEPDLRIALEGESFRFGA
jgi:hypothetical protein